MYKIMPTETTCIDLQPHEWKLIVYNIRWQHDHDLETRVDICTRCGTVKTEVDEIDEDDDGYVVGDRYTVEEIHIPTYKIRD